MAFKDGGTVKKVPPGPGTAGGSVSNPVAQFSVGLGQFQPEISPDGGTSTTKSGPLQDPNEAADNDLDTGSGLEMPEGPSSSIPAPGAPGGGTATFSSPSGGSPAYEDD